MTNLVQFPGLGLSFELNRVAFSIGGFSIYWYGVCIAFGICLALVFAFRHSIEFGVDPDSMVDVILIGIVLGIVSARAYYVAMAPFKYENIWEMIAIRDGGLAIYGGIIGGALVEYFSAMLTDNTIDAARLMADEGDRLLSIPGVLEGTVKPDYNRMIKMATQEALRRMLIPSVLALLIPVIGGFVFGVQFVGGLLVGATIVAIPRAIFMGNSGGAFDNAKKYIEGGFLEGHGKKSPAHKAAVTGDTVGDTRKDVVGVALDIFIKTMSTIANTLVSIFSHFTLLK